MPVSGGIHRIWYTGGRWAYMSALLEGFSDFIFITVDMSDPTQPREAGRFWLPGMNLAAGERPTWDASRKFGLHHAIVHGDTAYGAWRDGGLVVMDVADRAKPKLIVHRNWSPPYGGGTHNCLPLPDRDLLVVLDEAVLDNVEDGVKHTWIFDIREKTNPISIATLPTPADADYARKGGAFRPAQSAREQARQLHQLGTDLHHLPERRRPHLRYPRRLPAARGRRPRAARRRAA